MSPKPGQRCAKGLPKMQKLLRQLTGKDSFSVFQARIGKKMAATPAPSIRERACIEAPYHVSNFESRALETHRAQEGSKLGRCSITAASCTKLPPSRGRGSSKCYDGPRDGAILGAEESMSTVDNHRDLVQNPDEIHHVNLSRTDYHPLLPLASLPQCEQTEAVASVDPHYPQPDMPTSPSPPETLYQLQAGARLGTPASMVRESKSSLVVRPSRRRYRNLDGPLDRRFWLEDDVYSSQVGHPLSADTRLHLSKVSLELTEPATKPHEGALGQQVPGHSNATHILDDAPPPQLALCITEDGVSGRLSSDFCEGSAQASTSWEWTQPHAMVDAYGMAPRISTYSTLRGALLLPDSD
ncbi:hypothetical protein BD414DRAFT_578509 [Trametes punicea]|nr:hypothetical protein BD414DRAFT_578509 [Trametes punicea]